MNFTSKIIFIFLAFLSLNMVAQTLIWSEEFNYSGEPDPNKWGNEIGYIRNNELQYYTNREENQIVRNGNLEIIAHKESYNGYNYTSASLNTKNKFSVQYGRIEARLKLPKGQGIWTAFWTLGINIDEIGWPQCGEIDIMEYLNNLDYVVGTAHWAGQNNNHTQDQGFYNNIDPTQWHVYSIIWDETSITWLVDGNIYHQKNINNNVNDIEELHGPQYILLNVAVGGDWPGSPNLSTVFPATMFIDYVRVYDLANSDSVSIPAKIEAEDYTEMNGIQTQTTSDSGGGLNVGWIDTGDWMKYNIIVPNNGTYNMTFRVSSSPSEGGRLVIDRSPSSTYVGAVDIESTGGWQNWVTKNTQVYLPAGSYHIAFYAEQGGFNINWFGIEEISNSLTARIEKKITDIIIYPNPASDYIEFSTEGQQQNSEVFIFDSNGKEVLNRKYSNTRLNISNLTSGIYFVKVNSTIKSFLKK